MFKNLCPSSLGITGHQSEIIELALTYGFEGMNLDVAEFASRAKLHGMPYARRLIDSAKIRIGAFVLPIDWDTDDDLFAKDVKTLPQLAEAAVEVGCTRCLATLSPAGDKRPYHENFEFHRRRFADICKALEPSGVRFGVGFQAAEYLRKNQAFQFVHDFDALTLLITMVDAPNMGLLLDTWDLVVGGGSIENIRNLPPEQIVAVQVAEMPADILPADLDEKCRLLPSSADTLIDTIAALNILREIGYDGPVTVKPSRGIFRSRRREVIVRETADALDRAWRGERAEAITESPPTETTETTETAETAETTETAETAEKAETTEKAETAESQS